jgi:hypothetical protein
MIARNLAFFFVTTLCLVMGAVLFGFWIHHMYLVYKNYTTNERMKRIDLEIAILDKKIDGTKVDPYHNIYDKGFKANLREVLSAEPL